MTITLYDLDFHAWTQQQSDLMRTGKWPHSDVARLIEELESMGASEPYHYP